MQSQSVVGAAFTVQMIRNLARVKSLFVTLSRNGTELEDIQSKPESTQFYHPPLVHDESSIEFNFQIGGKRLIINPIGPHDSTQMYHNLQKAIGILGSQMASTSISMFEFLNTSPDTERRAFILAADLEKVLEAGYSGADFGNGNALLLEFKGVGDATAQATHASRVHILVVHEAAVSITDSGVQVSS